MFRITEAAIHTTGVPLNRPKMYVKYLKTRPVQEIKF